MLLSRCASRIVATPPSTRSSQAYSPVSVMFWDESTKCPGNVDGNSLASRTQRARCRSASYTCSLPATMAVAPATLRIPQATHSDTLSTTCARPSVGNNGGALAMASLGAVALLVRRHSKPRSTRRCLGLHDIRHALPPSTISPAASSASLKLKAQTRHEHVHAPVGGVRAHRSRNRPGAHTTPLPSRQGSHCCASGPGRYEPSGHCTQSSPSARWPSGQRSHAVRFFVGTVRGAHASHPALPSTATYPGVPHKRSARAGRHRASPSALGRTMSSGHGAHRAARSSHSKSTGHGCSSVSGLLVGRQRWARSGRPVLFGHGTHTPGAPSPACTMSTGHCAHCVSPPAVPRHADVSVSCGAHRRHRRHCPASKKYPSRQLLMHSDPSGVREHRLFASDEHTAGHTGQCWYATPCASHCSMSATVGATSVASTPRVVHCSVSHGTTRAFCVISCGITTMLRTFDARRSPNSRSRSAQPPGATHPHRRASFALLTTAKNSTSHSS